MVQCNSLMERWRIVPYCRAYKISSSGRLIYRATKQEVKGRFDDDGYRIVYLRKYGTKPIHIIVLETFVGPKPEGNECRHLNGNSFDNRLSNLVWGTRKQNHADALKHGTHRSLDQNGIDNAVAKLTVEQVRQIRERYKGRGGYGRGPTQGQLAIEYGVDQAAISEVVNFKSYRNC